MRMKKKKGWALFLAATLFAGILTPGRMPAGKNVSVSAAETTASEENNYGLKNPVMTAVSPPENTSHGLSNPRNDKGIVTWDCVYFGNYWQNDTNGDGKADQNDEKEPIKWRVLSVDGDDAFLLADTNLDAQEYNEKDEDFTWETSTTRSWLNGYGAEKNVCEIDYSDNNFMDNAFTESEQAAIKVTNVVNEDNLEYGTRGGNNTKDKIYFLSFNEVINSEYGFASAPDKSSNTRTVTDVATKYTKTIVNPNFNVSNDGYVTYWNSWGLRSLRKKENRISGVSQHGGVNNIPASASSYYFVRPVLHLDLSSDSEWKKTETVSSDGGQMTATWDCIWFGNYPQSDATGETKEPIKWRILSVHGDDAFLLADKNLDVQRYNDTQEDVTWETCTMRSWLNGIFLNNAFTESEQAAIKVTDVVNTDAWGTATGGNNTQDRVYLLSFSEAKKLEYGFTSTQNGADTGIREAVNTAYVAAGGEIKVDSMNNADSADAWWLRSPGYSNEEVIFITGDMGRSNVACFYQYFYPAVRPVLHLDLSSISEWSYAGTVSVSSNGEKNEVPMSNPPAITTPSATPTPSSATTTTPPASATQTAIPQITSSTVPSPTPSPGTTTTPPASATQTAKPQVTLPATQPPAPLILPPESDVQSQVTASPKVKTGQVTKVTGLKVKAKKKAVQASWKKVSGANGYEVQVSTSKKFTNKSVKNTKKTKLTINKLKAKKKYFVRVRAYRITHGTKIYGRWSETINVKPKI